MPEGIVTTCLKSLVEAAIADSAANDINLSDREEAFATAASIAAEFVTAFVEATGYGEVKDSDIESSVVSTLSDAA